MSAGTPVFIGFIFLILMCALYFHLKFTQANASRAPAILTTCGILGTFIGIALGLLDFNTSDIQNSVPALINGIKIAFWVSATGIFCALTIKLREVAFGATKISNIGYQGATANNLANLLEEIKNALVGSEESTLLGQIKLARQDSNDRIDSLKKSLDVFCDNLVKNNSNALIDALKEVIKDFNSKITEQFGDNFKQLNLAVGKMLEWQELYRQQISEMIVQQSQSSKNMVAVTEAMTVSTDRYTKLMEQAGIFNTIARDLSALLKASSENISTMELQRNQIDQSLRSLAGLINTATSGLPEIENKITAIAEQLGRSVKSTGDEFNALLLHNVRSTTKEITNDVKGVTKQLSDSISATNDEFRKLLLDTIHKSNDEFNTNLQKINKEINGNVSQLVEKTKDQIVLLDTALGEELTKSLETLGRQLASLSNRFVEDYTPLTNKLRSIVEMARNAA